MRTFIFACVHNAGRSQMSAAFFNQLVDPELAHAISAGTHPADHVHPVVVDAMREVGIDLSNASRKSSRQSWLRMPNCLSRWAAEMNALTFPVSGATTGRCPIPKDKE